MQTTFRPATRRKYLAAVASRDARWDGEFYYAVSSTRIYCRPSCPSRRPDPVRVTLFATANEAEEAGYRACRRCHPRDAGAPARTEIIRRVCSAIEADPDDPPSLRRLAQLANFSPGHLQRVFKAALGVSPREYADAARVGRLKLGLKKEKNVTNALYAAGYGSPSRLYEASDAHLGMTPETYRRGGRGMKISYTIADCSLGRVLVAATARGISAVFLADHDRSLEAALRKEYPHAEILRDTKRHSEWVRAIVRNLAGQNPQLDLPTDVMATAFQRRVWDALRKIPYGATRTYSEMARALGQPNATRAVASACATNPAAIVVPCHRVVRKGGALGGYRWGLERKEKLLRQERESANQDESASRAPKAAAAS